MDAATALLAAGALHAGFQATVTLVVYPALLDLPASHWAAGHHAHSRRIAVVVGPVYVAVAGTCLWALLTLPVTAALIGAVAGQAVAAGATAAVAAPAHGRLGREGRSPHVVRRLLVADAVRLVAALVGLAAAVTLVWLS
jgi:hypothetical protein